MEYENNMLPLEQVLRSSLEKINEARRCRSGGNLRKNLLITNIIYKTRNEILGHRTRVFMERNHQLPGIKGRISNQQSALNKASVVEASHEEVLEESLVQDELVCHQDEVEVKAKNLDEEDEIFVDVEKENVPPSGVVDKQSISKSRKRHSCDEDLFDDCNPDSPLPTKRATSQEVETTNINSICWLSDNFEKAVSFHCGGQASLNPSSSNVITLLMPSATSAKQVLLLNSSHMQAFLLQLQASAQQFGLAMATS